MSNSNYTWFAEPLDDSTNESIKNMIGSDADQSHILENITCADGLHHNLWELPNSQMVTTLRDSREDLNLKYKIWVRQGNGAIREWFASRSNSQEK